MKKSIGKTLSIHLIKTFTISCILSLAGILLYQPDPNPFILGVLLAFIIPMTVSSLTIYLNLFRKIRQTVFLSATTFFVPPVLTAALLVLFSGDLREVWDLYLILTLPFLFVHLYYFLRFRGIDDLFPVRINLQVTTKTFFVCFLLLSSLLTAIYYSSSREWKQDYYQGYITDDLGNPLEKAVIREDHPVCQATVSDSLGYFRLNRSSKNLYDLIISKDGYITDTCAIERHHFEAGRYYLFLHTPGYVRLSRDTTRQEKTITD